MGSPICQTDWNSIFLTRLSLSTKIVKKKSNTVKQKVAKANFPRHIQMQDLNARFKFKCLHLYAS